MISTLPKSLIEQLTDDISFEMVEVDGGEFRMGGESVLDDAKPVHKVSLSMYHIGKFPVTQRIWKEVMKATENEVSFFFEGDDRPLDSVSWKDAQVFIEKLNSRTSLHKTYRLPTEAEWEFAAWGGYAGIRNDYIYAGSNDLKEVGWFKQNCHGETKAVGQKTSNELGLYDMSGNVWEWCQDWYGKYKDGPQKDPPGPAKGKYRVARGGGWYDDRQDCHITLRFNWSPMNRGNGVGFRLALSL